MKIKNATVDITIQEIVDLIKKTNNIEGDVVVNIIKNEWMYVPDDWHNEWCPTGKIEVMFRDGRTKVGHIAQWDVSWKQRNADFDIVAYRFISEK